MADNEKMANDKGRTGGNGMTTDRDLGTAGGGTIPGSATTPHNANTDNGTGDRNKMTDNGKAENTVNTIDKHAQGNLGGRNPSQPQTAMGDRDPKGQKEDRGQSDITDPMISRDPSKINQRPSKDKDAQQSAGE
jgi:hypothetical protein